MKILRFILEVFSGTLRWRLVRETCLIVMEAVLGALALLTVAPVIDFFLTGQQQDSPITTWVAARMQAVGLSMSLGSCLILFVAAQAVKNGFAIVVRHCFLNTRFTILRRLIVDTWDEFFQAQWRFFSGGQQGTILNTLLHETTVVASAVWIMLLLLASLVQIVFYVAVSLSVSWQVTCISIGLAGCFIVPFLLLGKVNYRLGKLGTDTTNRLSAVVQESLGLTKVILGFGNQRQHLQRLDRLVEAHCRLATHSQTIQAATPLVYEPLGLVALIITGFAGRWFGLRLSEVAVLFWALRNCIPLLSTAMIHRNTLLNFVPSYEQIVSLRQRARELRQPSGTRRFTGIHDAITVEHLTFAYPGHEPVLTDVTLSVPRGTMIALVGASGVGKSTLIDLIMGIYQPAAGRIAVDGIPLSEFDIHSYRQRIGYVPQDSALFNMTIRDNLLWANPDATDAQIKEACRRAYADEFIERFPDGDQTLVGDRGVRLSGGQCQRIALARAVLRKPALLILDEATSSLDSHSERLIQQAIETIAQETTVIVIAHRLSTITKADRIYVVHGGRVVEEGTYQELVRQEGHFSQMTQLQALEA